jgi:conjugal transfer/entry exclusion protein
MYCVFEQLLGHAKLQVCHNLLAEKGRQSLQVAVLMRTVMQVWAGAAAHRQSSALEMQFLRCQLISWHGDIGAAILTY